MGMNGMFDPSMSGAPSSALFGGINPSNTMFASSPAYAAAHYGTLAGQVLNPNMSSAAGMSGMAGSSSSSSSSQQHGQQGQGQGGQGQQAGQEDNDMAGNGDADASSLQMDSQQQAHKDAFQEVTLRMVLEPYVSTAAEMDYIVKWLKTLFYVLVDRTLSAADLEHSLFVGSISLPALVAIHRSRCICSNPRLHQVHSAIVAYLKKIGMIFPPQEASQQGGGSSSSLLPTSSVTAPTWSAPTGTAAVVSSSSSSSSPASSSSSAPPAPATALASGGVSIERALLLRPTSIESLGSTSTGDAASTKDSKRSNDSTGSIDVLADAAAATSAEAGRRKRNETADETNSLDRASKAAAPSPRLPSLSASVPPSDLPLLPPPAVLSGQNMGGNLGFQMTPANMRALFGNNMPPPPPHSNNEPSSSSAAGMNTNAEVAGGKLPHTSLDALALARYHAEVQAVVFAEQLAWAKAQAEAQAKALAESYHSKQHSASLQEMGSLSSVTASAGVSAQQQKPEQEHAQNTASSSSLPKTDANATAPVELGSTSCSESSGESQILGTVQQEEQERVAEADDHLMHYHKALVQSLAAERALKKTAATAARIIEASSRGLPRPYQQSSSQGYNVLPQPGFKRRKITEFNEAYLRAAYNTHQQQELEQEQREQQLSQQAQQASEQAGEVQPRQPHSSPKGAPLTGDDQPANQYQPGPESSEDSRLENRRVEEQDRTAAAMPHPPQSAYNPRMGEGYHYNHALATNAPLPPEYVSSDSAGGGGGSGCGSDGGGTSVGGGGASHGQSAGAYDRSAALTMSGMPGMPMMYDNSAFLKANAQYGTSSYPFPPTIPTLPSVASQMTPEIFSQFLHSYYAWPYGTPPIQMMPPPPGEQQGTGISMGQGSYNPLMQQGAPPAGGLTSYGFPPSQSQDQRQEQSQQGQGQGPPMDWAMQTTISPVPGCSQARKTPSAGGALSTATAGPGSAPPPRVGHSSSTTTGSVASSGATGSNSNNNKYTLEDCLKMMQRSGVVPPASSSYPGYPSAAYPSNTGTGTSRGLHSDLQSLQQSSKQGGVSWQAAAMMPRYSPYNAGLGTYPFPPPSGSGAGRGAGRGVSGAGAGPGGGATGGPLPPYPSMYPVPGIPASLLSATAGSSGGVGGGKTASTGARQQRPHQQKTAATVTTPAAEAANAAHDACEKAVVEAAATTAQAVTAEEAARKAEEESQIAAAAEQGHSAAAEALLNLFNK